MKIARPNNVLKNPKLSIIKECLNSTARIVSPKILSLLKISYMIKIGENTKKNLRDSKLWIAIKTIPTIPKAAMTALKWRI